jgi:anti-sigma B factor antagonist
MPHELVITVTRVPGAMVIALDGDLDMSSAPRLQSTARELVAQGDVRLIVDASGLRHCGPHGVRTLVEVRRMAQEHGGDLRLSGVQGALERILDRDGLRRYFVFGEIGGGGTECW